MHKEILVKSMKTVGIIAEYNPFHNGHQYHIEEALRKTDSDAAVVLMSGDFVQRGTPAIAPKHLRAKAAISKSAAARLAVSGGAKAVPSACALAL